MSSGTKPLPGRRGRALLASLAIAILLPALPSLSAQTPPGAGAASIPIGNAGFEEGAPGTPPPQWAGTAGAGATAPNYRTVIDTDNPREGRASARIERVAGGNAPQSFGALTDSIDAQPYRGHRIRLTGAVRTDAADPGMVGLWLRVDRPAHRMGFFDNMGDRPIRNPAWSDYVIEGNVAGDAERIYFGLLLAGGSRAWLDDVRLQDLGPLPPPSAEAVAYLDAAIALIRAHHINAAAADWPAIIADAHAAIGGAAAPSDTHAALRGVLSDLGEPHSSLRPASRAPGPGGNAGGPMFELPVYSLVDGRVGLVQLPGFAGTEEEGRRYTQALREGLKALDRHDLCGWIVDLSGNGGGNMWPMLNGLDPLLGPAPFGSFRDPSGDLTYWVRRNGSILPDVPAGAQTPAFRLRGASLPVAVLLGPSTASSGEITATALIGRHGVRTFGAPTAGFTTANRTFPLADGARLVVTTAFVRDRTGREYRTRLTPDEPTAPAAALAAARSWLAAQGCAGGRHRRASTRPIEADASSG